MEENSKKKQLTPLIIGVLALIVLVVGATFAYFSVTSSDTSGTTVISGDIGGGSLGTITLSGGNTALNLAVTPYDMSESNAGKTYYSSSTENSRETDISKAAKTTYTAELEGGDATNAYSCDYEFTVKSTGTLTSSDDIFVVFEGDVNRHVKLQNSTTGTKISGTLDGITSADATREISAYLKLKNTYSSQNTIAGKNFSIEITNTNWKCYLYTPKNDEGGDAYAILTDSGDGYSQTLTFVRSTTPMQVGDMHKGKTITTVFDGIETTEYATAAQVPWTYSNLIAVGITISEMVFETEVKPKSIAYWFNTLSPVRNGHLLNTSETTNMESAFATQLLGDVSFINNLDTSNVTNMKNLFNNGLLNNIILDLSKWDTSKVTDMSGMFGSIGSEGYLEIGDLSGWDTSKVTNMSSMFANSPVAKLDIGNIGKWNTESVTNMSNMFLDSQRTIPLDLSGWNVAKVTNHSSFATQLIYGDEIIEEDNKYIIQPTWNN